MWMIVFYLQPSFGEKGKSLPGAKFIDGYAADADFYDWAKYHYRVGKVDLRTYRYYRNNPESTCEQLKVKLGKKNNSTQIK